MSNVSVGCVGCRVGGRVPDDDPAAVVEARWCGCRPPRARAPRSAGSTASAAVSGRGGLRRPWWRPIRRRSCTPASRLAKTSSEQAASTASGGHGADRTCPTVPVPSVPDRLGSGDPLQDAEGAEAGGVDQGLGLADAAAGGDAPRGRRARPARAQTRRPSSTSSSMPWAARKSAWDRTDVGAATRASWSTATSQVMSCRPGRRAAARPAVAGVGAQPGRPRAGRPGRRWCGRSRCTTTRPPAPTRSSAPRSQAPASACTGIRAPTGASGARRPRTTRTCVRGQRPSTSIEAVSPSTPTAHLLPAVAASARPGATGRLSSSSLARTTTGPSAELAGRRQVGAAGGAVGVGGPLPPPPTLDQRRSDERVGAPGRGGQDVRASVPGPAPASTTMNGVGLARARPTRRRAPGRARRRTAARPRGW